MSTVPANWQKAARAITPGFEVSGDPYLGVSGDFDKMGISCGALQWNIGQNSLQPMVKAVGKPVVNDAMPNFGNEMWAACNGSISGGLTIVRGWQNGSTLKKGPKAELVSLMGTTEMRTEQDAKIKRVAERAFDQAARWAKEQGNAQPSKRLFCWFFDLVTQNGSLEGLTFDDVAAFIKANQPQNADDVVCDFLQATTGTSGHAKDARKNAQNWRNNAPGEKLELLCMSYLRSKTANPKWRHVVLNRKGAIAIGQGWVNSTKYDFSQHGL
jgi:hypothetical protein